MDIDVARDVTVLRQSHSVRVQFVVFFFQAEDGIRDLTVTGVQTCALPISVTASGGAPDLAIDGNQATSWSCTSACWIDVDLGTVRQVDAVAIAWAGVPAKIGRASCRERV